MTSLSSFLVEKIGPTPIVFKFQGAPKKPCFQDGHLEIRDTKVDHIYWNAFLIICNEPKEITKMVSKLIRSRLVNITSHPTTM